MTWLDSLFSTLGSVKFSGTPSAGQSPVASSDIAGTWRDLSLSRIKQVTIALSPYLVTTAYDSYFVLSTGGAITLTLPSAPSTGMRIAIYDDGYAGQQVHAITVSGNGKMINGYSSRTLDKNFISVILEYTGTDWRVVASVAGKAP